MVDSITHLTFGFEFDKPVNNLPNSIIHLTFEKLSKYNNELNCLPNFVEQIELPVGYSKQIKKFPIQLKKIICSKNYKFLEDFKNYLIKTYINENEDKKEE